MCLVLVCGASAWTWKCTVLSNVLRVTRTAVEVVEFVAMELSKHRQGQRPGVCPPLQAPSPLWWGMPHRFQPERHK